MSSGIPYILLNSTNLSRESTTGLNLPILPIFKGFEGQREEGRRNNKSRRRKEGREENLLKNKLDWITREAQVYLEHSSSQGNGRKNGRKWEPMSWFGFPIIYRGKGVGNNEKGPLGPCPFNSPKRHLAI